MISFIIRGIVALVGIALILAVFRTWQMERSTNQKLFLIGTVASSTPEGLYNGIVPGHVVSWIGKKFDSSDSTGINVFKDETGKVYEQYPFVTKMGKSLKDKDFDVIQIDYNTPANPFWLKYVLDEIVEVAPGEYLGKLNVKIIPGYPFTLAFFTLKK